jgi:glycosyltransferase involved in cell wall biosynthesis
MCFPAAMLNIRKPLLRDFMVKKFMSLWDSVVVINQFHYQYVRDYWCFDKKCIVINNYYDMSELSSGDQDVLDLTNVEFRLVYCGRFDWYQKGLDWLIKYISNNKNSWGARISILIKGEGDYEYQIKEVTYLPGVSMEKWSKFQFKKNDVLVLTSRYEGFPLVAIEAISADIPVIATRSSGLIGILNPECLYDFGNDKELSKVIEWVTVGENYIYARKIQKMMFKKINSRTQYLEAINNF